jgi:hypothetical protein
MSWQALEKAAKAEGLALRGGLHPTAEDAAPDGCETLVLLGPNEPSFWALFSTSPEYHDGAPNPLDRWSKRVLGALAADWGGTAIFPSDGPPFPPFLRWAAHSHQCWPSPVGPLVHAKAGLFVSYRGVLALPQRLDLPAPSDPPCNSCHKPCETACPVGALSPDHFYDVAACKSHLRSPAGTDCRENGCLTRRACPVAIDFERLPAQSAFHTAAFLKS